MTDEVLIHYATEAAKIEQEAISADRASNFQEAIKLYQETERLLSLALDAAPDGHSDIPVISTHVVSIQRRVLHLKSAMVSNIVVPVEAHIVPVKLSVRAEAGAAAGGAEGADGAGSSGDSFTGTAAALGGVGGLLLLGPIGLIAGAGGAAYAAKKDKGVIGSMTRAVASTTSTITKGIVDLNNEHNITGQVSSMASSTVKFVKDTDEKLNVTGTLKDVTSSAVKNISDFNTKYKVTDKVTHGVTSGFAKLNRMFTGGLSGGSSSGGAGASGAGGATTN